MAGITSSIHHHLLHLNTCAPAPFPCGACQEPVYGRTYQCAQCPFVAHEACAVRPGPRPPPPHPQQQPCQTLRPPTATPTPPPPQPQPQPCQTFWPPPPPPPPPQPCQPYPPPPCQIFWPPPPPPQCMTWTTCMQPPRWW